MNGLLEVDMELSAQNHPIHQLIRDAKGEWEAKSARQSRDLKGAVKEYRRRNGGRNPPKGFDKWWEYQRSVRSEYSEWEGSRRERSEVKQGGGGTGGGRELDTHGRGRD